MSPRNNPEVIVKYTPQNQPSKQVTVTQENANTISSAQAIFTSNVQQMLSNGWTTIRQGTNSYASDSNQSVSSWSGQDAAGNLARLWLRGSGVNNADEYALPSQGTPSVVSAIEETVPGHSGGMNLGLIGILVAMVAVVALLVGIAFYRRRH
jgi:hypothetical protein